jgi:hypothetical protein
MDMLSKVRLACACLMQYVPENNLEQSRGKGYLWTMREVTRHNRIDSFDLPIIRQ